MGISAESEKIETFVKDFIKDKKDLFLVEVKIAPGNKVTVLLDGDNGITIDDCTIINKALYKFIEETQVFGSHNFSPSAWGMLEKEGSQLAIANWELGVVFLPEKGSK